MNFVSLISDFGKKPHYFQQSDPPEAVCVKSPYRRLIHDSSSLKTNDAAGCKMHDASCIPAKRLFIP